MFRTKARFRSMIQAMFAPAYNKPLRRVDSERLGVEDLENRVVPATLLWKGDGNQNDWSVATNWIVVVADPTGPPAGQPSDHAAGPNDIAQFSAASTNDSNVNAATTVGSLVVDGYPNTNHITLNATLTTNGGQLSTTTQTAAQYSIGGASDLIVSGGTFTWTSGTMAGTGTAGRTVINSNATLVIASSTTDMLDARLAGRELKIEPIQMPFNSPGIVNFTSGRLFFQNDPGGGTRQAGITNAGQFNVSGTASSIVAGSPGKFTNESTGKVQVNLNAAESQLTLEPVFDNNNPDVLGAVTVLTGQLLLTGGGTSTGTWAVGTGDRIGFTKPPAPAPAPTFKWNNGTQFFGTGEVQIKSATVTIPNGVSVPSDAVVSFWGGTLTSDQGFNRATLVAKSKFNWEDGSAVGLGTIQIPEGAQLFVFGSGLTGSGNNPTLDGWNIENSGNVHFGGAAPGIPPAWQPTRVDFKMGNGAILENKAGGVTAIYDTSNILKTGQSLGKIKGSAGSLVKLDNTGISKLQVQFEGLGGFLADVKPGSTIEQLDFQGGVLNKVEVPAQPKKMSFLGPFNFGTTLLIGEGGLASGVSNITSATLQNDGTVSPGGGGDGSGGTDDFSAISIEGDYTQTATGDLAIDIGDMGNDQIAVTGAGNLVSLAGTLDLTFYWTTDPAIGTKYTIISNGTSSPTSGSFDLYPDGYEFSVGTVWLRITYNRPGPDDPNDVILEVIDPSSGGSGGSGGSISGVSWEDTNADGIRDAEPLLTNVQVNLLDEFGTVIDFMFTGQDGSYGFFGLGEGTYRIQFVLPSESPGFTTQDKDQNQFDTVDSDVDSLGVTMPLILGPDQELLNIDAGLLAASSGGSGA